MRQVRVPVLCRLCTEAMLFSNRRYELPRMHRKFYCCAEKNSFSPSGLDISPMLGDSRIML